MNLPEPPNSLNRFVTYTTHFELHAASSWEELRRAADADLNLATERKKGNGSLLINTRRDAHQHIDNVKFISHTPKGNPLANGTTLVTLSLEVTEPGGTFFLEKVLNQAAYYNVTDVQMSLIWGLKIFYVGRLANGSEETVQSKYMIPLSPRTLGARYDHRGGDYKFEFNGNGSVLAPNPNTRVAALSAYTNKNITIRAKTIQEAFSKLEERLNGNYDITYDTELSNQIGAKRARYKINCSPEIVGDINLISRDSFAENAEAKIDLKSTQSIVSMIQQILMTSREMNDTVAASNVNLNKQLHEGVNIPVVNTRYYLKEDELEIAFDVFMYKGGGPIYEFDYYFAGAGKSIDVLNFEVKLPIALYSLTLNNSYGSDLNTNASSTVQTDHSKYYAHNICHPDTTRDRLYDIPRETVAIAGRSGDVAQLNYKTPGDLKGFTALQVGDVGSYKRAANTFAAFAASTGMNISFSIRGHAEILEHCISYPDASVTQFGMDEGLWIKVNIYDENGDPFFYTGYYDVITIENIFSGGQFTQNLVVIMKSGEGNVQSTTEVVAAAEGMKIRENINQQNDREISRLPASSNTAENSVAVTPGGAATGIIRRRR